MPRNPDAVDPTKSPVHLLGAMLRNLRLKRGDTLDTIAGQINVDLSALGRWERGDQLAPVDAVERLDKVFGTAGILMALHALAVSTKSGPAPLAGSPDLPDPVDMDNVRRSLLLGAAAAGASTLLPGLERLRTIVNAQLGGPSLTDWEELASEYGHGVISRPLAETIRDLSMDVLSLQQTLADVPSRDAVGWARVNARMTFLLAHALGLAGETRESRHWWNAARRAAEQTGENEVVAAAHAWEAVQALYENRPLNVVLRRADTAIGLTEKRPGRATAEALCARAYALTLMGDRQGALASLERQADVFTKLPDDVTRATLNSEGWGEPRLLHTRSLVLTTLGDPAAPFAQQEALNAYPQQHTRQIAQIGLHRAASAVRDGSVDEGLDAAASIVESLGPGNVTQFVRHVAHGVADAVPVRRETKSAITQFRERLAITSSKGDM
ncbi:helix-turn-helix transcriptional regulator [Streptosporangium sp. NPDC023615]|uniref:helix-turn-helix domain-containing protein n=1 Tax=Streptosporangium sp. NPDC023615 TaxID=3154794 RepID=UPI0034133D6E